MRLSNETQGGGSFSAGDRPLQHRVSPDDTVAVIGAECVRLEQALAAQTELWREGLERASSLELQLAEMQTLFHKHLSETQAKLSAAEKELVELRLERSVGSIATEESALEVPPANEVADVWDLFLEPDGPHPEDDEADVVDVWDLFLEPTGPHPEDLLLVEADTDDIPDVWELFVGGNGASIPISTLNGTTSSNKSVSEVDAAPTPLAEPKVVSSTADRDMSRILEDVLGVENVAPGSNFFDDLGADSLVMAHFCAKVTKSGDLPSLSIKDVYQHPTIAKLTAHLQLDMAQEAETTSAVAVPRPAQNGEPISRARHLLCGLLQMVFLFEFALLAVVGVGEGYDWVGAADGSLATYTRLVAFGALYFAVWVTIPVVLKWLLIGRWKAGYIRIWSLEYVGFWLVKLLIQANPIVVFAGSPIYTLYLRALGANIGKGTVVLSRQVGVCADLFTAGNGVVVRAEAVIKCYRAIDGYIQTGPVTLGSGSFVGAHAVLEVHSVLGEDAQLGHASALDVGQTVPDGAHVVGNPATQSTTFDYMAIPPIDRSQVRRTVYPTAQLLLLLFFTLPLATAIPYVLYQLPFAPHFRELALDLSSAASWAFVLSVLEFSTLVFFGSIAFSLLVAGVAPRMFARYFTPGATYPLFGLRYALHRLVARVTNSVFLTRVFGDSSYILHYLHYLGYDVSFEGQTGANFGVGVRHDSPYFLEIGSGTMVADGLTLANSEIAPTSFRLAPASIAGKCYLGNNIVYPPQAKMGEDCLFATKVMVPCEGETRTHVGILGSPGFEIPRMVERDRNLDEAWSGNQLDAGLASKNRHNIVTIFLFIASRWFAAVGLLGFSTLGVAGFIRFGSLAGLVVLPAAVIFGTLYNIVVDRASTRFTSLEPVTCSLYDEDSLKVERYWKLSWNPRFLNGTPMKSVAWRLLGVKVGKRVFDDGCGVTERTLLTIGDDCTLNTGTTLQSHSQEDGAFKSDRIVIGSNCTIGTNTLVHYGVTMGNHVTVGSSSFVMKGTSVPTGTAWGENPARELGTKASHH